MYSTRFGFWVDRPVSSGLEQHGACRATLSNAGVEHSQYRAHEETMQQGMRPLAFRVKELQQLTLLSKWIQRDRVGNLLVGRPLLMAPNEPIAKSYADMDDLNPLRRWGRLRISTLRRRSLGSLWQN